MVDARLPADARMPRGARVNVVLPPLSLSGPAVTIRLFPKAYGLAELLQRGTLDRESAELLATCVRARLNIVVSGGTASGKTTLLNALSQFVPGRERIVTVEDAAELSLEPGARDPAGDPAAERGRPGRRSPSATWSATRCGCARTGSSSARSAAARRWTCCRR